jgi:hypothetical protein
MECTLDQNMIFLNSKNRQSRRENQSRVRLSRLTPNDGRAIFKNGTEAGTYQEHILGARLKFGD